MSDIPSAHPTKDQICTKVLNDLSDMAKGCKSGGFKNLKSYIETVKADLESGTFPKYPFLEMASGRLYEDYWGSRFFKRACKKQFWDYAIIYFSIHDAADKLRTEMQYKQVLESALGRKQPDDEELSNRVDRHHAEFNRYVRNLNWPFMTRDAKFDLTAKAIQDLWSNYYSVCHTYLVSELNRYVDNEQRNKTVAHDILKYKKMCGYYSDVQELRNSISHACGVKREGKQITFALYDRVQEELTYDEKEFYYLPFFIVEKTRFVFAMMSLIHLDIGIRLIQNYDNIVFDNE